MNQVTEVYTVDEFLSFLEKFYSKHPNEDCDDGCVICDSVLPKLRATVSSMRDATPDNIPYAGEEHTDE